MNGNEAFEGLNSAFDTDFKGDDIDKLENEVKVLQERKETFKTSIDIEDEDYLKGELKSLIVTSKIVLEKLQTEIKIGSGPGMYDVYTNLLNSITNQLKELRQLNQAVAKVLLEKNKKKTIQDLGENGKISLTANQLMDMISTASEKSEMNRIEADFVIDDSDDLMKDK
jgi:hypothetical protein